MTLKISHLVALLSSGVFASQAMASIYGRVSGSVLSPEQVSISKAKVRLLSPSGVIVQEKETSPTGEFSFFSVKTGKYLLSVEAEGFETSNDEVSVSSDVDTLANVTLNGKSGSSKEMVIEVKAKRHLIQNTSTASKTTVNQEEIRQLPQGSEVSLPKLITSTTPGVVGGSFGQMFFRGNHANTQYQIDGVQLPESPSNTFGQAFSPRNIDQMEVITGGFNAEYGMRLSSVVNITTQSGPEKPGGEIELNYGSNNTTSPHLIYGGSNESGSLHYFLSASQFFTNRGIDTPQPESLMNLDQGGSDSVHNRAFGNSEFAKVDWQADNSNKLSFIAFHSYSHFQIPNYPSSFVSNDPFFAPHADHHDHGDDHNHDRHDNGHRDHDHHGHDHDHDHDHHDHDDHDHDHGAHQTDGYNVYRPWYTNNTQSERNFFLQTVWKHSFSEKSFLQLAPYYKYSQVIVTNDPENDLYTAPGGANPVEHSAATSFAQNRHVNNLGLKGDYSVRATDDHLIKTGFQFQGAQSDGFYSVQRSLDNSKPTIFNSDSTTSYFESVYVQDEYRIAKPLTLNIGLRFDATQFRFADARSSDSMLQPRVGLSYLLTDTTQLHFYYGKLFQPAAAENLRTSYDAESNEPTTYDIRAEKDDYYEVGVAQQFLGKQIAQFNVFYKDAENMLDDAQLHNTSLLQPYNYAKGYAYGAELSVRGKVTEDWSEYVNYSYTIAKGKGISGGQWASGAPESDAYQFLDHVQVHTANMGVTYSKNYFWWTGQSLFGSGLRTGAQKEKSLPSHITFDTTVGYEFHGKSWLSQFRLSGDVLNILDNRYPITIANSFTGSHYAAGRQFFVRLQKGF